MEGERWRVKNGGRETVTGEEGQGMRGRGKGEGGKGHEEGTGHCATPLIPHHYPGGVITHPGYSS